MSTFILPAIRTITLLNLPSDSALLWGAEQGVLYLAIFSNALCITYVCTQKLRHKVLLYRMKQKRRKIEKTSILDPTGLENDVSAR